MPHAWLLPSAILLILTSATGCKSAKPPDKALGPDRLLQLFTYRDGVGREVNLPKRPMRIISLAPSVTEVLYLLGADDRLVGVTSLCDWPADTSKKQRIGDLLNPNYERIIASRPDLIIASTAGNDRSAVMKLTNLGLPVFVTAPRSVEKIYETVESIGQVTDCADQAGRLVAQMKSRIQVVRERLKGLPLVHAFFITWFDPLLAPGKETFETDVLRMVGVESITADIGEFYPRYSLEQVLAHNPEVILSVDHKGMPLPDLKRLAGWKQLDAVKNGKVYLLNEVLQHPSPRFVDGVEEIAGKLHPEKFK